MADPYTRGKLKLFLGYAAGVGKTFQMLDEAQTLQQQGHDVVVGYFEPHARPDTIAKTEGLEMIPRRKIEYRGSVFEEMDTPAILARHPEICVVDEYPHTNIPGTKHEKRWQDVQELLDAGICVLTTMNIQHLESLNDQVSQISGVRVRETVPDWVVQQADEVVMVDLPPQALLNRLLRGAVYPPEKVEQALQHFFKKSTLVALRELALRQAAHEVETRQVENGNTTLARPQAKERILIHVTAEPTSAMVIRRAKRVADYLHADCIAVAIHRGVDFQNLPAAEREAIGRHLNFARNLHIGARLLQGGDVPSTLITFPRLNGVTQVFLARPPEDRLERLLGRDLVQQIVRLARDMQVTVVADRSTT